LFFQYNTQKKKEKRTSNKKCTPFYKLSPFWHNIQKQRPVLTIPPLPHIAKSANF